MVKKSKFWLKIKFSAKNANFGQKSNFSLQNKFFCENQIFRSESFNEAKTLGSDWLIDDICIEETTKLFEGIINERAEKGLVPNKHLKYQNIKKLRGRFIIG